MSSQGQLFKRSFEKLEIDLVYGRIEVYNGQITTRWKLNCIATTVYVISMQKATCQTNKCSYTQFNPVQTGLLLIFSIMILAFMNLTFIKLPARFMIIQILFTSNVIYCLLHVFFLIFKQVKMIIDLKIEQENSEKRLDSASRTHSFIPGFVFL